MRLRLSALALFICLASPLFPLAACVGNDGTTPGGDASTNDANATDSGTEPTDSGTTSSGDGEAGTPNPEWTFALTSRTAIATSIVEPVTGDVYVGGWSRGNAPELGVTATNGDNEDALIAKLDGKTGAVVWAKTFGGTGDDVIGGMTLSGGALYIVGTTTSASVGFPGATPAALNYQGTTATIPYQSFVARVDPSSGAPSWAMSPDANETAGTAHHSFCEGLSYGAGLYVACNYQGSHFGPSATPAPVAAVGAVAVIELNSLGAYLSGGVVEAFAATSGEAIESDLAASGGYVYLAGAFTDTLVNKTTSTNFAVGSDGLNGFVLRFPEGATTIEDAFWTCTHVSNSFVTPSHLIVNSTSVILAGSYSGTPAFSIALPTVASQDMFVMGLNPTLTTENFNVAFGGSGEEDGLALALDGTASPSLWLGGTYASSDFTLASKLLPLGGAGSTEGVFAKLSVVGVAQAATPLVSQTGNMGVASIGTDDANGYLVVVGTYNGLAKFDDGSQQTSASDSAGYVLRRKIN